MGTCAGPGLFLIGEGLAVGPGENFLSHIRASLLGFGTFRLDQVIYQLGLNLLGLLLGSWSSRTQLLSANKGPNGLHSVDVFVHSSKGRVGQSDGASLVYKLVRFSLAPKMPTGCQQHCESHGSNGRDFADMSYLESVGPTVLK